MVFFTLIDPQQPHAFARPADQRLADDHLPIGFQLLFWLLCSGASLMTYLMLPGDVKAALSRHADEHRT